MYPIGFFKVTTILYSYFRNLAQPSTNSDYEANSNKLSPVETKSSEFNVLDELNVASHLIYKNPGEDAPDVKGGTVDVLIVHATVCDSKNGRLPYTPSVWLIYIITGSKRNY